MKERIDEVADSPGDTTLGLIAGLALLIPYGGDFFAASINEWRQYVANGRLVAALEAIREAVEGVRGDVDRALPREELAEALDWVIESATQARNARKRDFYGAAFAHSITIHRPAEAERAVLLDTLDQVQPVHLALLAAVESNPNPSESAHDYIHHATPTGEYVMERVPGVSEAVLARCWEDLAVLQLVAPAVLMHTRYNAPRRAGEGRRDVLTDFGRRFLEFVRPTA